MRDDLVHPLGVVSNTDHRWDGSRDGDMTRRWNANGVHHEGEDEQHDRDGDSNLAGRYVRK